MLFSLAAALGNTLGSEDAAGAESDADFCLGTSYDAVKYNVTGSSGVALQGKPIPGATRIAIIQHGDHDGLQVCRRCGVEQYCNRAHLALSPRLKRS